MEHIALYRQFRPMNFDEIVEQDGPVSALRQAVKLKRIGHAYLFSGQRGTGKTSIAKVFSRAVNCESPINGNPCNQCAICKGIIQGSLMDVIEIDAASNNSVDNVRRICEEVNFAPSKATYKVYIIDEVHMLSQGAFNALLKTLEEPPKHVVFLFATTEPHRIPATILSRCQRFDFKRITSDSIVKRLKFICDKENFKADDDALNLIASLSDGAMRDAVSLLDQTGNSSPDRSITRDGVLEITGTVDDTFLGKMAKALLEGDFEGLILLCDELFQSGRDIVRFSLDLAEYFRNLLAVRVMPDPRKVVKVSTETLATMYELCKPTAAETLVGFIAKISSMISELKWSPSVKTTFEISLINLCGRKVKIEPVPLVVPDFVKKQQEAAKKIALETKPLTPAPSEEKKGPEKEDPPKPSLFKKEEKKTEPEVAAEPAPAPEPIPEPGPEPVTEKQEEKKEPSAESNLTSSLFKMPSLTMPTFTSLLKPSETKKEEEPKAETSPSAAAPEPSPAPAPASSPVPEPDQGPVPSILDDMLPPPPMEEDIPPVTEEPLPEPPAPVMPPPPKEEIDPEDIPMPNQIDLFSIPSEEPHKEKPSKPAHKTEAPKSEKTEVTSGSKAEDTPLIDLLSKSFIDDIGSGPVITHYEPEAEEPPKPAPTTSLVQAMEGESLPQMKAPEHPPVKETAAQKPVHASSDADINAIWKSICGRIMNQDYMMYVSLNETSLKIRGDVAYIVFDDTYKDATLKRLTSERLYSSICNDIMTAVPGTRQVIAVTKSGLDAPPAAKGQQVPGGAPSGSPLQNYLGKAEQLGIDIRFGDD